MASVGQIFKKKIKHRNSQSNILNVKQLLIPNQSGYKLTIKMNKYGAETWTMCKHINKQTWSFRNMIILMNRSSVIVEDQNKHGRRKQISYSEKGYLKNQC